MVTVGAKGSSASSISRCLNLHTEALDRNERLKKATAQKEKAEAQRLALEAVPCGDGKRGASLSKLESLYEDHKKREKNKAEAAVRMRREEEEKRKEEMVGVYPCKKTQQTPRRTVPPWKDPNYPFNLHKNDDTANLRNGKKDPPQKNKKAATSQADYALMAIQATISTRAGGILHKVRPQDYKELVKYLKDVMACYRDALVALEKDPGFLSLCSRASQRLFQEHLVPEFEGWSHRLEPDPIRQVEDDIDDLITSATQAHERLKMLVAPGAPWPSGTMRPHPSGVETALWALDVGVKSREAAETKALVMYAPGEGPQRCRHLVDLSRLTLVFASCDVLQAGIEHIMRRFEVVDVRNFFSFPGRLGVRFVEILVVVHVGDGPDRLPHVCELRLECLCTNNAREKAGKATERFFTALRRSYSALHMDADAVQCIAHHVLSKPAEGHRLRAFRCHLATRYGSTVSGWRRALGGCRLVSFSRFRDVCYSLHCGEHVTELWQELDSGRGGCISLWELDPEATTLLVKFRGRMMSVLRKHTDEELDAEVLFSRLAFFVRPLRPDHLELHEFRVICRPLGLSVAEADRTFACLDQLGGSHHAPPATISVIDIGWLKRLPSLLDIDSVVLVQDAQLTLSASLSHLKKKRAPRRSVAKRPSSARPADPVASSTTADRRLSHSQLRSASVDPGVAASTNSTPIAWGTPRKEVRREPPMEPAARPLIAASIQAPIPAATNPVVSTTPPDATSAVAPAQLATRSPPQVKLLSDAALDQAPPALMTPGAPAPVPLMPQAASAAAPAHAPPADLGQVVGIDRQRLMEMGVEHADEYEEDEEGEDEEESEEDDDEDDDEDDEESEEEDDEDAADGAEETW